MKMSLLDLQEAVRLGTLNGIKERVSKNGCESPAVLPTAWAMTSVALRLLEYGKYEVPKFLAAFFIPYCGRDLAHAAVDDAFDAEYRRAKKSKDKPS
ncbi:MAG: hypothetical protein KGL39_24770 [Patescibacteria group bacterium]|nr:hypothetical protein [Patescibacteria group bacterium]